MRTSIAIILSLLGAALVSYLYALAGEPQSVWLWRDILGVING